MYTEGGLQTRSTVLLRGKEKNWTVAKVGLSKPVVEGLKANKVQVYSVAGWYAGGAAGSLAALHAELGSSQSQLTLGPWSSP